MKTGILAVLFMLTLIGLGAGILVFWSQPPTRSAEKRAFTKGPQEELVKAWILNNAQEGDKVEFVKWGPHMTNAELLALLDESGVADLAREFGNPEETKKAMQVLRKLTLIRVCFKSSSYGVSVFGFGVTMPPPPPGQELPPRPVQLRDELFVVRDKLVMPFPRYTTEPLGDDWKTKFRKNLAKVFPAIKQ
jgi:hypothetical protein